MESLGGGLDLPEGGTGGEHDFGSLVMTEMATVSGTIRTTAGQMVVHQFVDIVCQAEGGHCESSGRSAMASKDGSFSVALGR